MPYVPDRGDIVWITFDPQAGHEQAGRRPAITLSPALYNQRSGLAIFCPITSRVKGYSYEVLLPTGLSIQGVILADQVKSLDWNERNAQFIEKLPEASVRLVLKKLNTLLKL